MKYCLAIVLCVFYSYSNDLYYPVGYSKKNNTSYFTQQTDSLNIELFAHNISENTFLKLLPSYFNPAGFRLLPNEDGFSFIHNDTLYIKKFSRRSPKRIEFFEPLYGINTVEWIDEQRFYFAAQQQQFYRIYEGNINGDVFLVVSQKNINSLFPQKKDNYLFFIQNDGLTYQVASCFYNESEKINILLDMKEQPIACLKMLNTKEGYFIAYQKNLLNKSDLIPFSYYYLKKDKDWQYHKVFDFYVPDYYFVPDSSSRAYEAIIPFLPHIDHDFASYVNFYKDKNNQIYKKTSLLISIRQESCGKT